MFTLRPSREKYVPFGAYDMTTKERIIGIRKGGLMMKALMSSVFALTLLLLASPVVGEETAKEGTLEGKTFFIATNMNAFPMGNERVQINYEAYGVSQSVTGNGLFHNASVRVLGSFHAVKGIFENESGMGCFTRPDGDQIFMTYQAAGQVGKSAKGTWTLVGGTGECTGIQGSGEFTRIYLRPPAKDKPASISISKGSYKIP
jgi:hypothetical protein